MKLSEKIMELFDSIDHYGSLHILVEDGNTDDCHLLFCLLRVIEEHDPKLYKSKEVQLIELLSHVGVIDRDNLYHGRVVYFEHFDKELIDE